MPVCIFEEWQSERKNKQANDVVSLVNFVLGNIF
jgi:hypothetical protein